MNRSIKELKRQARENLTGNYRPAIAALILLNLIPMILELPFSYVLESASLVSFIISIIVEILIVIISNVMSVGYTMFHMKLTRQQKFGKRDLFYCFTNSSDYYFKGTLLKLFILAVFELPLEIALVLYLYVFDTISSSEWILLILLALAGLLLGGIAHLFLGLYDFVLLDEESIPVFSVLKKSLSLMKGQFFRLFKFYLSFLGMEILVYLSLGIGKLWVSPYLRQSLFVFYQDVIGEQQNQYEQPHTDYNSYTYEDTGNGYY